MKTCNLFVDVLYTIAPETTPAKLPLCVVVTLGAIINLVPLAPALPASAKSAADFKTVAPIPTPPKQAEALIALISVSSNISSLLSAICPLLEITIRCAAVSLI